MTGRSAFLALLFAVCSAEDCGGPRTCVTDYDCGMGLVYSCQAVPGEEQRVCLPTDPAQYAAVVSAYLNKKAQQCAESGHELKGKVQEMRFPVPGKPFCEQVIKQQVCKRCKSNITIASGYEGDCGELPAVRSCQ